MRKRLTALVLALMCLWGVAAAQGPVYGSTRAFVAMLMEAKIPYESYGVEAGEDSISIEQDGYSINCYFSADEKEVCFIVWYLIEYDPAWERDVMLACNRLNALSDGPRFFADGSDCSVTAMMELILPWNAAGVVTFHGYQSMIDMLGQAREILGPYDIAQSGATTSAETAAPMPAVTPVPTPAPASTPTPALSDGLPRVVVTEKSAYIRSGPNINTSHVATVKKGEAFPCIGVSGNWYIIEYDGQIAFLSMTVAELE